MMKDDNLLDSVQKALNRLEKHVKDKTHGDHAAAARMASRRPVLPAHEDITVKAFGHYLRKGQAGLYHKALTREEHGTYLVPQAVEVRLHEQLRKYAPLRSLARVSTVDRDCLDLIFDDKAASVGWSAEQDTPQETATPSWFKMSIPVHQMYAKPKVSQQLLDDARIDVEEWLIEQVAHEMGLAENQAFVNGDGQGKPKGILSYPVVPVGGGERGKLESLSSGKTGGFNDADVLVETVNALKPQYLSNAVWMMSRSTLSAVRLLKEQQTGRYVWQPSLQDGQPGTLLGFPVVVSEALPELSGDKPTCSVIFGDFHKGYQIVDRSDMHILRDPYSAKPFVEFYATKRVGGDVTDFDALKVIRFAKNEDSNVAVN